MKRILCLDFDGVLCNSIKECALVAYNAYHETNEANFDNIPRSFSDFFLNIDTL